MILVSNQARISRPKAKIDGIDTIIKSDQFRSAIERANESDNNPLTIAKLIGADTLEHLAHAIAAQHKPIEFDWEAKFGIAKVASEGAVDRTAAMEMEPMAVPHLSACAEAEEPGDPTKQAKKKLVCATCSKPLDLRVARFCWFNKGRFGGNVYCMDCQKAF